MTRHTLQPLFRCALSLLACATLLGGAGAWAQESGTTEATDDSNLLAGPDVDDESAGATDDMMTTGRQADQRQRRRTIPPRLWLRELNRLSLTDAQQQAVDAEMQTYEAAQRAYLEEHGPELRQLAEQLRQARLGDVEASRELRDRVQELRNNAPQFEAHQQRIWEQLTVDQRAALTIQLEDLEQRLATDRENRRMPMRGERQRGGADRGSVDTGPGMAGFDDRGRQRLRFLMQHRRGSTGVDEQPRPRRRLPAPPPPSRPQSDRQ